MVLGHTGTCTLLMLMTGVTAKEEARQVWMVSKEVLDRAREVRLSLVLAGTGTGLMLKFSMLEAKEMSVTAKQMKVAARLRLMVRSALVGARVGAREEAIRNNVESNWSQAPSKQIWDIDQLMDRLKGYKVENVGFVFLS